MPSFKCIDIGMKDGFEIKDANRDELKKLVFMHTESTHNMKEIPPDMREKIEKAIKE